MRFVDELEFAFGWIAPEPRFLQRTSHAIAADGGVWVVDPVDDADALERARSLGDPAGVVQLLDRHQRDCARVATRLGAPHVVVPSAAPDGAPFVVIPVLRRPFWREVALWFPAQRTLVCADALGTVPYFRAPDERIGVSPPLRLRPPRALADLDPEHVLVGHGEGVHEDAAAAVRDAVAGARRRLPAWFVAAVRSASRST